MSYHWTYNSILGEPKVFSFRIWNRFKANLEIAYLENISQIR
jgi:hypothetical protein